jgi:hypothetical protein
MTSAAIGKWNSPAIEKWSPGFIVSGRFDSVFFLFSPLLALALVAVMSQWTWGLKLHTTAGIKDEPVAFLIAVWTLGHNFAVVFRSHFNPEIFALHRYRFTVVPLSIFVAFMFSDWLLVSGVVIGAIWGLYHIAMQTFGFCRIYDSRWGNPPEVGRRLDYWLNLFIFFGPILWGVNMVAVFSAVTQFSKVGWHEPAHWLQQMGAAQGVIADVALAAAAIFAAFYVYSYWRLSQRGYRVSPQKIVLILTSIAAWVLTFSFLSAWQAFFVGNFFHALQYFAIVWWKERKNIQRGFGLESAGNWLAFLAFASSVVFMGVFCRVYGGDYTLVRWTAALTAVIALMHYWYDGFVWSVQKRQV